MAAAITIVVGSYGQTIVLTVKEDGVAVDISSYTGTKTLYARSPASQKTVEAAITFASDGTDGRIQFSFADGDIDVPGIWKATAELKKSSNELNSSLFDIEVEPRVGA